MKHAYLILAHEYSPVLETFIKCIDDERNDVFVHVDKNSKAFPFQKLREQVKQSNLIFVPRVYSNWASFNLCRAELALLEAAVDRGEYVYYHLLSGADLPLKSQNYIHRFFKENNGKQFLEYSTATEEDYSRIRWSYFLQNRIRHGSRTVGNRLKMKCQRTVITFQKAVGLAKNKKVKLFRGAQWFSITDSLARYLLSRRREIAAIFNNTLCPDELFVQTVIHGTAFEKDVYTEFENKVFNSMRYIDWGRGNPYVFQDEDYDLLINSGMLFARKFSAKASPELLQKLWAHNTGKD